MSTSLYPAGGWASYVNPEPGLLYADELSGAVDGLTHRVFDASDPKAYNGDLASAVADAVAACKADGYGATVRLTGSYSISDEVDISGANGLRIIAPNRFGAIVTQTTDGKAHFISNTAFQHSVEIAGMKLTWANQQTTSNTGAYGIKFGYSGGSDSDYYLWNVHDLWINRPYIGIGIDQMATGKQIAAWGNTYKRVWIQDPAHDGFNLISPLGVGMPNNVAEEIYITALNTTPDGYAVRAACELRGTAWDIEDWTDHALLFQGGFPVSLRGVHFERITLASANQRLIYNTDGPIRIEDLRVATTTISQNSTHYLIVLGSAGSLVLDTFYLSGTTVSTGALNVFNLPSGRNGSWIRGYKNDDSASVGIGTVANVRRFESYGNEIQTFADGDTSPSVRGFYKFKTANTSGTTITTFDDGHPGQEILIIFTDANTTIAETDNIKLSASFTSMADATMRLVYDGASWFEISRSVN